MQTTVIGSGKTRQRIACRKINCQIVVTSISIDNQPGQPGWINRDRVRVDLRRSGASQNETCIFDLNQTTNKADGEPVAAGGSINRQNAIRNAGDSRFGHGNCRRIHRRSRVGVGHCKRHRAVGHLWIRRRIAEANGLNQTLHQRVGRVRVEVNGKQIAACDDAVVVRSSTCLVNGCKHCRSARQFS